MGTTPTRSSLRSGAQLPCYVDPVKTKSRIVN
jgi:hypothetical protein